MYVYAKWYYFCRKVWVWMQESWKVGVIFLSLAIHVFHPQSRLLLSDFGCPKSPLLITFSWLHLIRKSSPSFSTLFLVLVPSCSFAFTRQPSLSHQNKISLSKKEIKGLTLKFQLPSLWVTLKFLLLYPLSWF